jgi:hypothetical protein
MNTALLLRELAQHLHTLAYKANVKSYEYQTDPTDDWFFRGKYQAYRTAADVLSFRADMLEKELDRELTEQEAAEMARDLLATA